MFFVLFVVALFCMQMMFFTCHSFGACWERGLILTLVGSFFQKLPPSLRLRTLDDGLCLLDRERVYFFFLMTRSPGSLYQFFCIMGERFFRFHDSQRALLASCSLIQKGLGFCGSLYGCVELFPWLRVLSLIVFLIFGNL